MSADGTERALSELARGRRARAITVAVLLFGSVAVAVLVLLEGTPPPTTWLAVGALAVLNLAYGASVVTRERAAGRLIHQLVSGRAQAVAERERERALEALHAASRAVMGSLELTEVTDRVVDAAVRLAAAEGGALALRVGGSLATAARLGMVAGAIGERRMPDAVERAVLADGEARVTGRGGDWGDGPPTLVVPVALPDRVVGTLTVRRGVGARPFAAADRLALTLLAEHAALALRNATLHDRTRQRADALVAVFGDADWIRGHPPSA